MAGLLEIPGLSFYGIRDFDRFDQRTPTAAFRLKDRSPREVEERLSQRGIYVWSGNFYAIAVTERLGLEGSGGVVRAGTGALQHPGRGGLLPGVPAGDRRKLESV